MNNKFLKLPRVSDEYYLKRTKKELVTEIEKKRRQYNNLVEVLNEYEERIDKALTLLKAFGGGKIIIFDVIEILKGDSDIYN